MKTNDMIHWILIILIVILFVIILIKDNQLKRLPEKEPTKSIMIRYEKFKAKTEEIAIVEKQIAEKGFWNHQYEWKLMTATECRIEPKIINDREVFLVNVKCEHEIEFTATTIERAITFKKIYENLQQELYSGLGWSSWKSKNSLN